MRKFGICILSVLYSVCCFSQNYLEGKQLSKWKEYADSTMVYFVGIIHINSPVVIGCKDSENRFHQPFVMSRKDYNEHPLDYSFLNKEYAYLLEYNLAPAMPWTYIREGEDYLITDWHEKHSEEPLHGGFELYYFETPPDYYHLYLIRGDAYNQFTFNNIMDGCYEAPLNFPADKAYYKMVVPYWNH